MPDLGTKQEILAAAEKIFSKKGLTAATISEIAKTAGVTDSVIYHYFKNKEDLLFSTIALHLTEVIAQLQDQLAGILEPVSRLSKMVWFHLKYNETHKDYSRLLLFECRSNPRFYDHPAHDLVRNYAGTVLSILDEGVQRGVFDEKTNMRVVRDIILGALEMEILEMLTTPEGEYEPLELFEFMATVRSMIEIRGNEEHGEADKAIRILEAAEKEFAEKGYNKSTISKIALLAKVAEGTVYEYFKNKEDLLIKISEVRFKQHIQSSIELFQIKTPTRKLRRFMRYHFFLYTENIHFLKIFLLHIQLNPKFYTSEAFSDLNQYQNILDETLKDGKREGSFHSGLNNKILKNLLFGGFSHMALRWLILEKKIYIDKMQEIDQFINLITRAAIMS